MTEEVVLVSHIALPARICDQCGGKILVETGKCTMDKEAGKVWCNSCKTIA